MPSPVISADDINLVPAIAGKVLYCLCCSVFFYHAMLCISAAYAITWCVCLSVRLSVFLPHLFILS